MILRGIPNQHVHKRVKKRNKWKVVLMFVFDSNGLADIDETKLSAIDLSKLKRKFKVIDEPTLVDYTQLKWAEFIKYAKSKKIDTKHKKRDQIEKELGEL